MLLTQNTGIIMGPITTVMGWIFNAIYNLFFGMGVESIALSIFLFTIVIRLILFPFNLKTTKSSKIQQYLRPEFNKITKKYRGKKDQESMLAQQNETRELQEKYGIKMSSGCLISLVQFPVFIGLYNVIQNIPAYVTRVRELYQPIATQIVSSDNAYKIMSDFVSDNKITRITTKMAEFTSPVDLSSTDGHKAINSVIDILYKCNGELFAKVTDLFSSNPEVGNAISANINSIERVNHFLFGINLAEAPGFKLTPALLIPIISALCQLLSMVVMPKTETGDPQQDQQMESMRKSMYMMPVMSFIVTVSAPAGLGIYWATSAFISFLITVGTNFYYDKVADMDAIVAKQKAKAAKEIAKRKASGKKTFSQRFTEAAMGKDPSDDEPSNVSTNKSLNKYGNMNLKNYDYAGSSAESAEDTVTEVTDSVQTRQAKKGSLADRANAVKRFNDTGVQ